MGASPSQELDRPTSVIVGALTFAVKWESGAWEKREKAFGQCDPDHQTIRVVTTMSPERTACVFAHEIMHAVTWFHYGTFAKKLSVEQVADVGSYDMVAFWRANPDAFRWWVGLIP